MAFKMKKPVIQGTTAHKASIAKKTTSVVAPAATSADAGLVAAGKELGRAYMPEAIDYNIDHKEYKWDKRKKKKDEEDDGPKEKPVLGCMDATATNFSQDATEDDGSCTYEEDDNDNEIDNQNNQITSNTTNVNEVSGGDPSSNFVPDETTKGPNIFDKIEDGVTNIISNIKNKINENKKRITEKKELERRQRQEAEDAERAKLEEQAERARQEEARLSDVLSKEILDTSELQGPKGPPEGYRTPTKEELLKIEPVNVSQIPVNVETEIITIPNLEMKLGKGTKLYPHEKIENNRLTVTRMGDGVNAYNINVSQDYVNPHRDLKNRYDEINVETQTFGDDILPVATANVESFTGTASANNGKGQYEYSLIVNKDSGKESEVWSYNGKEILESDVPAEQYGMIMNYVLDGVYGNEINKKTPNNIKEQQNSTVIKSGRVVTPRKKIIQERNERNIVRGGGSSGYIINGREVSNRQLKQMDKKYLIAGDYIRSQMLEEGYIPVEERENTTSKTNWPPK